jgi:GNAT superfamily N-acetyltransferase
VKGMNSRPPTYGFLPLPASALLAGLRMSRPVGLRQLSPTIGRPFWWPTRTRRSLGFATVYLDIVSVRCGQRAWVEDLAVAPNRRSSGIGKALDAAKSWARDRGAARLELQSRPARVDAHRFYEREQADGWSRCFRWTL